MSGGHRLCADRSEAKTGGIPMAGRKPKPTALKKLEGNQYGDRDREQDRSSEHGVYCDGYKGLPKGGSFCCMKKCFKEPKIVIISGGAGQTVLHDYSERQIGVNKWITKNQHQTFFSLK